MQPITTLITVPNAGTPVQWTPTHTPVCALLIQAWRTNTGDAFFGTSGLNKSTGDAVIAVLAARESFNTETQGRNVLQVTDYWFDVTTNGDKFLVTYWVG